MRGKSYIKELKEEILREVKEVGNVSLVSRRHGDCIIKNSSHCLLIA
ncbi:hypothetical protein HYH96_14600 [Clostridium botulinum]|nr:hypothetical protein [Clostridium botulinum]MBD5645119.1 hypothetical protein [Clostridium botulinum]